MLSADLKMDDFLQKLALNSQVQEERVISLSLYTNDMTYNISAQQTEEYISN